MAIVRPFRALRPRPELAAQVAALPYDVMNSDEAREMVKGNPYSFLHVDKAEIDLDPGLDLYDEKVYLKAGENLQKMAEDQVLVEDTQPCFYIYRQVMNGREQTGLVACASIDDYLNNIIKKHENTRADKEADRIKHVDYCDANTGPIFLTYRAQPEIAAVIKKWTEHKKPIYDICSDDGISHIIWLIDDRAVNARLQELFQAVKYLYIADGHHRCASAVRVGQMRRQEHPAYSGQEEFNYFLAVIFPDNELHIMDYNRVVKDLNGLSETAFLDAVGRKFDITPCSDRGPYRPECKHRIGMYLQGRWYTLKVREGSFPADDPVERLDVSILQNQLLRPILGIDDPRTDKRIDFIGGIRGLQELERRVEAGMAVAFSMYPTEIEDLMDIADAGKVMPPKSTWFEPKLRSGLFIHKLS
ncbi:MAG TPA: DUF1015 domain-containing protein [Syntrophomonas sp.]|jgi:uncharacterized protein (DUF1015 family)|nr:DUF1015 domain-containing protein [Syntrophomonas sp.]